MGSSAREMIDRQPLDTGDPEDEVYHPQTHGVGGNSGKHESRVYHDDDTCWQLEKVGRGVDGMTREDAQQQWLGPCKNCVLNGGQD